jgi:hypothetical protein
MQTPPQASSCTVFKYIQSRTHALPWPHAFNAELSLIINYAHLIGGVSRPAGPKRSGEGDRVHHEHHLLASGKIFIYTGAQNMEGQGTRSHLHFININDMEPTAKIKSKKTPFFYAVFCSGKVFFVLFFQAWLELRPSLTENTCVIEDLIQNIVPGLIFVIDPRTDKVVIAEKLKSLCNMLRIHNLMALWLVYYYIFSNIYGT